MVLRLAFSMPCFSRTLMIDLDWHFFQKCLYWDTVVTFVMYWDKVSCGVYTRAGAKGEVVSWNTWNRNRALAPLMKQKHSPRPVDLLAGILSLCMKETDQGKGGFKAFSCSCCTHNEGASAPMRDLWLAIHLRDAWYIALALCDTSHIVCVRAIRSHCGSDLAILHTLACSDQMGCRTIWRSESSAKLCRALKP